MMRNKNDSDSDGCLSGFLLLLAIGGLIWVILTAAEEFKDLKRRVEQLEQRK